MKGTMLKKWQRKETNHKRKLSYLLICSMAILLLAGCNKSDNNDKANNADAVSSASVVDNDTAFVKSISAEGNWIICLTKDLTIKEEAIVDGEFTNGKKDDSGKDIIQRKIALYAQDADRNITDRYTLTVPQLTIKSPNASLQHGKFVGDIIVDAEGFQLIDNVVEGNIYFTSQEVKNSFLMDETSSVSGVQEIKE
ncbi:MAG: hypothetical protein K0S61_4449 [Anaerocolumna sp.]|jgi:hypothetical protein|nr:hypothetical protein [Anaerocolumna sp.]